MSEICIKSFRSLIDEMKAAAKGKRPKKTTRTSLRSFESKDAFVEWTSRKGNVLVEHKVMETLARLLTEENRLLLKLIYDRKPDSIARLAEWTNRAPSNVTRTLDKFERLGLIEMLSGKNHTKVPRMRFETIALEVDLKSGTVRLNNAGLVTET